MPSEPILYGAPKTRTNIPIKSSSTSGHASSDKLSSQIRNILSNELKRPLSFGSDESVQPMNPRRRFQRRGSKSASMFRALSSGHVKIEPPKRDTDQEEQTDETEILINSLSLERVPNESTTESFELSAGESSTTFSSHIEGSSEFS
eukprot:jgi/Psemu1/301051/fgenesh1_kg.24_\